MSYEIMYQNFSVVKDGLFQAIIITGSNNTWYSASKARTRDYYIVNKEFLPKQKVESILYDLYDKLKSSDSYRLKQKTAKGFVDSFFNRTFKPEEVLSDAYKMDKLMKKVKSHRERPNYVQIASTKEKQKFSMEVLPRLVGKRVVFYNIYNNPILSGKVSQIGSGYGIKIGSRRYRPISSYIEWYVVIK